MGPENLSDVISNGSIDSEIPETESSKEFYKLVQQEINSEKIANDPNLPEEERAREREVLNKMKDLIEQRLQELSDLDQKEIAKKKLAKAESDKMINLGKTSLSNAAIEEPEGDTVFVQPDGTIVTKPKYGGLDRDDQDNSAFGRGN